MQRGLAGNCVEAVGPASGSAVIETVDACAPVLDSGR